MITIRHATLLEKHKTYEWLCLSDTTPMHMGEPNFPNSPVPSWDAFNEDFEDFYYQESGRDQGSVMIISKDDEEIGCLCYACFHLKPHKAELDIWLKERAYCGNGYGTQALSALIDYLEEKLKIDAFIIRPSSKNARAVKAYEKVGFEKVANGDKKNTVKDFLLPEYFDVYGEGDYGFEETEVLTKGDLS